MVKRSRLVVRDACRQALIHLLGGWLLLSFPGGLYGQSGTPVRSVSDWKAHLSGPVSLDSLTSYLNRHSHYRLTFDAQKVKGSMMIRLSPGVYDMPRLLTKIRSSTGLSVIFHGDHIILRPTPALSSPAEHAQSTAKNTHDASALPSGRSFEASPPFATIQSFPTRPSFVTSQSFATSPPFATVHAGPGSIVYVPLPGQQSADTPAAIKATRPRTVKGNQAWSRYLQAGFSANEVLYLNAGVEAGFRVLHLLVSGGASWHTQVWGIGLGSVVAGDDHHQYEVKVQYFPMKIDYIMDSSGGVPELLTVKGQLLRGDLLWDKRLGNAWLLKAGPDVSLLRTHYYVQGTPAELGIYTTSTENLDKQFYLLKPPDLLHNSFSRYSPANTKWWIGLSIGLYYDLPSRSH